MIELELGALWQFEGSACRNSIHISSQQIQHTLKGRTLGFQEHEGLCVSRACEKESQRVYCLKLREDVLLVKGFLCGKSLQLAAVRLGIHVLEHRKWLKISFNKATS